MKLSFLSQVLGAVFGLEPTDHLLGYVPPRSQDKRFYLGAIRARKSQAKRRKIARQTGRFPKRVRG